MRLPRWTHSLKWRVVASYSLILVLGGVSTSVIGIRVTGRALLRQAQQQMDQGLSLTRTIYQHRLQELQQCVELLATGGRVDGAFGAGGLGRRTWRSGATEATAASAGLGEYLTEVRRRNRLDFLTVVDETGRTVLRIAGPGTTGDVVILPPVAAALRGETTASTELVPVAVLEAEDPALAARVTGETEPGPAREPVETIHLDEGMVLWAAAAVVGAGGEVVGAVYAGQLLNDVAGRDADGQRTIVEQMAGALFPGTRLRDRPTAVASIFQEDVRIMTTVRTDDGRRAVGTRVSPQVYDAVLKRGQSWSDRAFVANNWYIAGYEPIRNMAGERIGMLGVGLLQRPYTAVRDSVTLIFATIALICFVLIVVVTYFLTRGLMRPLEEMVAVSRAIADGDLSRRMEVQGQSELGVLGNSFNAMLDRIHEMDVERYGLLEQDAHQWTEALEQKVRERTEQLAKTQTAMDRHQRLAALGQLAAGVAHEINNPLGGILTFASLVQEELPPDSPLRGDVEEIVTQADRCRKIVQELLEFSRQREARTVAQDINDVVSRTLGMLEKQSSFQNIEIVRRFAVDVPPAVVDESQMQQVFMNIILNAVDAMQERGTLTVETGQRADGGEVFVCISDTGCGIPKKLREAIFDPFFTTKAPGQGTGLGLAVVCRIVQAHNGRLEVDSDEGRGTSFTIILPAAALKPRPGEASPA